MVFTLAEWRRCRGISQQAMADALKIHVNTYQKWEYKPERINIKAAEKICDILGVTINDVKFEAEN